MSKKILGLDLGTNSIGWAVVNAEETPQGIVYTGIDKAGCRIIPMDAKLMGDFEAGNSISQTKDRTFARGVRRLFERRALRRERLNRVLTLLGYLPDHYIQKLNRYGQLIKGEEPKLAWKECNGKSQFLFMDSFTQMCEDFRKVHPELLDGGKRIAYDWTIYYLRKKALTQCISGEELAWILLQANQKRGYNQARGEEEETNPTERKEFMTLRVTDVRDTGEISKGRTWYEVTLDNGWIYRRQSQYPLDWIGKEKNFIVTTKLNEDGSEKTDSEGAVKRSLSIPGEDDWGLIKVKTEQNISMSGKTVGEFIYDALLENPDQKIIGNLVRTVDRKYYKDEMHRIVKKQMEFHPELRDKALYKKCLDALYMRNDDYRKSIMNRDFDYLLVDNILFYQRPLKSKKSLINECPYEFHIYKTKEGEEKKQYLKCIPKSHPLYEEFRVWQWVQNLRIYCPASDGINQEDCTDRFINSQEYICELVNWLRMQTDISEDKLLTHIVGKKHTGYSWNYVSDRNYPMAPVTSMLVKQLHLDETTFSITQIEHLWHILYSVSDKQELTQAIKHYAESNGLNDDFVTKMSKVKPFESAYGSYSLKAIKKLLTLMRCGSSWNQEAIDAKTRERIEHLITGEFDQNIPDRVREKCATMTDISAYQGMPFWLAEYVVFGGRDHSTKWEKPDDIDDYLQSFRLHSLNNPIVEQVVMETLRVVRDIWKEQGTLDEIHVEMGRDIKNNADKRQKALKRQMENERANMRAKVLLTEFMNPDMGIEGIRAYSPSQLELFRIYEEGVLQLPRTDKNSSDKTKAEIPEDIQKTITALSTSSQPTHAEVKKYRLWLDQQYKSPYTGQPIPLSKLFTSAYEIEHIIPQSRYFDDSMNNKVICEAEVNKLKDRQLAHEFIVNHKGEAVTLSGGRVVHILTPDTYAQMVKEVFAKNKAKCENLLLDDIPEKFIQRQMNDSRYISVLIKGLLSNIVRELDPKTHEYEMEATSKNLIVCTGTVTDMLKRDWGAKDVWNHIILPRFERMNEIQGTDVFTNQTASGHTIPNMPIELNPSFQKKRIDHRHHAMDAVVIACATRNHVNLISNEAALPKNQSNRYALSKLLRKATVEQYGGKTHEVFGEFNKPWDTFTQDMETCLNGIVVSMKQNLRVITKSNNHYMRFENGKKKMVPQTKGDNWAIRKSLHKDTVFGLVNLRFQKPMNLKYAIEHLNDIVDKDLRLKLKQLLQEGKNEKQIKQYFVTEKDAWQDVNLSKIAVWYYTKDTDDCYYATRKSIDPSFDEKTIRESVTDTGIQRILTAHLNNYAGDPKEAFSPEGIENMNANIETLNGGAPHKPIYKVRKYEKAEKFAIGTIGAKGKKYVEAAKGTNLFCAFYAQEDGKRNYITLPLKVVIEFQKQSTKKWKYLIDAWIKEHNLVEENAKLLFILSPNDIVYLPTLNEVENQEYTISTSRLYKAVSFSGKQCMFIPAIVASSIVDKVEFLSHNKMERAITGEMIKETCIPVQVDRLGNITVNI